MAQRKVELSKIELLEEKLGVELAALTQKMDALKSEMQTYSQVGDLQSKVTLTFIEEILGSLQFLLEFGSRLCEQGICLSRANDLHCS